MNLTEHRIPAPAFDDLARGGGGSATVKRLAAAQHSKHLLLIRGVLDAARRVDHARWARTRRAYDLLATIQGYDPEAVDTVLRHPAVGAWARHTIHSLEAPEQLAAVAAAVAIRARATCEVDVPVIDGRVTLPSLGQVTLPGDAEVATVHSWPEGAEVSADGMTIELRDGAPGWQELRAISARAGDRRFDVLIDDLDPHRMPGSGALHGRLSESEATRWQGLLDDSWGLLVDKHELVADEVAAAIKVFTPLQPPEHGLSSATSRDTFGCVALSSPPDSHALAVTLAHETQHAKLSALLDIVPLTRADDGSRYYAPWRDDPRPVAGLLQGAYAYLGVTNFWRRQRRHEAGDDAVRASAEFTRWRSAAHLVTGTLLGSGRLTGPGTAFVDRMGEQLRAWADEPVPAAAVELARDAAGRHRSLWRERNGDPA